MYNMAKQPDKEALYDNLSMELRRGALVLAVLSQLSQERYGYSLKQSLDERGMGINEGTLYPLLRRLEKQGLLNSEWRVIDDTRPRRYYRISPVGEMMLSNLKQEWTQLTLTMDELLIKKGG
jgi:PadR family transcriptional regulator PadR